MNAPISPRRPLARRLMLALFVLMMAPVAGWTVLGDFGAGSFVSSLSPAELATLAGIHEAVRWKLALTLAGSVVLFGLVVAYLRRTVLAPLERLAEQARQASAGTWSAPPEIDRPDETGDLARALDGSVRALAERAREAEELARDLGHELRTPLATIRGAGELLADSDLPDAERQRFAGHVVAESERLERLVEELLDLARLERQPPPLISRCGVEPILGPLGERYRHWLEQRGKRLEVSTDPPDLAVLASVEALERSLVVLLENAESFSPEGGKITISARRTEEAVAIAVSDQGPGLPPEEAERIFDRAFSKPSGVIGRAAGTGLGLAIARRLVESMGGSLSASNGPDGGARFVIRLPPPPVIVAP
jgi:signal transduction histidine kinase